MNGNVHGGFHGPKSRILPSESGSRLHLIKYTSEHNYVCCTPCLQFQMYSICSHSLAASADNNDLHCYVDLYLQKNKQTNLTAASIANASRHAGKRPGHTARNRKKRKDSIVIVLSHRATLRDVLQDIPADCSKLQYSAEPEGTFDKQLESLQTSTARRL